MSVQQKAPTVAGSASGSKQAAGHGQAASQTAGAWSLLSKVYGSQMLSYMVAIDDAKAIMDRMRHMRPGPPLHLPAEVQCMNIWQVLQGCVQQQRVWTFGRQQLPEDYCNPVSTIVQPISNADKLAGQIKDRNAALTAPPGACQQSISCSPAQSSEQVRPGRTLQQQAVAGVSRASTPHDGLVQQKAAAQAACTACISSCEPLSVMDGVKFTSCSAGPQHSAATAEGGFIYTWGCNDQGQLGCDTTTQLPSAVHVLGPVQADMSLSVSASTAVAAVANDALRPRINTSVVPGNRVSTAAAETAETANEPQQARTNFKKSESLIALAGTMRLPQSLVMGLAQQQHKEQQEAAEEEQQERLCMLAKQQQQSPVASRKTDVMPGGVNTQPAPAIALEQQVPQRSLQQQQQAALQQQSYSSRQPSLLVYRLHVGQSVRTVACGGRHTLAALTSSGLMAWGHNDKGQLGLPRMYKQVQQPMRVHGFDGQRLMYVSAGNKHSAAVYEGGVVCTWGHGRYGRLGVGGTPDILPPSIVGGLRGCTAVQVACGTAHTLTLISDGRVYAWGYNGQGALGTGDDQDRLVPTLVLGLAPCIQVAAAASSLALSNSGEVYQWGGSARSSVAANRSGSAAGVAASTPVARKAPLAWLEGAQVVQIACGVETAAAVTNDGKLVLWGGKQNMPPSMLQQAQALAADSSDKAAAAGLVDATGGAAADDGQLMQTEAAEGSAVSEADGTAPKSAVVAVLAAVLVTVTLTVSSDGRVAVACSYPSPAQTGQPNSSISDPAAAQHTAAAYSTASGGALKVVTAGLMGDAADDDAALTDSSPVGAATGSQTADDSIFDPGREPIKELCCGAAHHVVLCQPSQYTPAVGELRSAVLTVLQAYIKSYLSRPSNSLNALMQQAATSQLQAEAAEGDCEGSIAQSGVTRKSKVLRAAGSIVGGYAASIGSYAASTTGRNIRAAVAAATASEGREGGDDLERTRTFGTAAECGAEDGAESSDMLPPLRTKSNFSRPAAVAFAGNPLLEPSVADHSSPTAGAAAASCFRAASAAGSVAGAGGQAGSVMGCDRATRYAGSAVRSGYAASTAGAAAVGTDLESTGAGVDELGVHGVMLLCREVGLIDNITEHLDIIRYMQLMLHRKRGRLGPSCARAASPAPAASAVAASATTAADARCTNLGDGGVTAQQQQQPACEQQDTNSTALLHEPEAIRVIHVVRPGEPALPVAPAPAAAASVRPPSPEARLSSPGPGVRGDLGSAGGGATEAGVLHVETLNAEEVLELLLLVLKERHPRYRRQPEVLLRLLAGWHIGRLQGRKPEKGPPWLLRQMLQPGLLQLLESADTTEMLHGIYIHLAGSSSNPQDLSMNLADIRLGLKHAAGFRSLQEIEQPGTSGHPAGQLCGSPKKASSSPGNQHRFEASTESSRGRSMGSRNNNSSKHKALCGNGDASLADPGSNGTKTFHVPLHKVAAFLRTAKLLPRLFEKYVTQLQRLGEEQRDRGAMRGLPVMPVLRANVSVAHAGGFNTASHVGHKHRLPNKQPELAGMAATQQRQRPQPSRLAPLQEASSISPIQVGSNHQQHQQQTSRILSQGGSLFGGQPRADSFQRNSSSISNNTSFRVGSPGHESRNLFTHTSMDLRGSSMPERGQSMLWQNSIGSTGSPSAAGTPCETSAATPVSRTGAAGGRRLQQVSSMRQSAGQHHTPRSWGQGGRHAVEECVMVEGGTVDAVLLDSVELMPMQAKAASIIIQGDSHMTGEFHSSHAGRAAGGSGARLVLQLLSPHSHLTSSSGTQQQQQGDAVWEELVRRQLGHPQQQKQQQQKQGASPAATGAAGPRSSQMQGKGTYQQQQDLLKKQRQAAEADSKLTADLETARQDTWTVCVLVELLGSHLISPPWEATVKLTQPNTEHKHGGAPGACGEVQQATCGCSMRENRSCSFCCSWNNGYVYTSNEPSVGAASPSGTRQANNCTSGGGGGYNSFCGGSASVDLMNHCISYPQFIEVLLCVLGARATTLLEPDVKQLRSIALDDEMKDHAKVILDRIQKWRATQLTPWKVKASAASTATAADRPASGGCGASSTAHKGTNAAPGSVDVSGPVAHLYGLYSEMKIGADCLGLTCQGFLKLLADAHITGGESDVTASDADALFQGLVDGVIALGTAAKVQQHQPAVGASTASKPGASPGSVEGAAGPPLGPSHRQSTFMRTVTAQLLHKLELSTTVGVADKQYTPPAEQQQPQIMVDQAANQGSIVDRPANSATAYSDLSIYEDDGGQGPMQGTSGQCVDEPDAAAGVDPAVDDNLDFALQQWEALQQSLLIQQTGEAAGQLIASDMLQTEEPAAAVAGLRGSSDSCVQTSTGHCGESPSVVADSSGCNAGNTNSSVGTRSSTAASSSSCSEGSVACGASPGGAAGGGGGVLTPAQFKQALVILSRKCFRRIGNASRAWKLLVDRHVRPLADKKHSRFDEYQHCLATPGVVALLTAWQDQLQQLYQTAADAYQTRPTSCATAVKHQQPQQQQHGAGSQRHLGLSCFLELLQERGAIPSLLQPADVLEVLKRLRGQQITDVHQLFTGLSSEQFSHALAMCGLAVFGAQRLQSSPLKQPEQQLAAFLTYMGLTPLPAHEQILAGDAAAQQAASGRGAAGRPGTASDPYEEWWSLEFDPATESRQHDHLSSLTYMPVMMQEHVSPPSCCPQSVKVLLSAAQSCHQSRQVDEALQLYAMAEEDWRQHVFEQENDAGELPLAAVLYLSAAASSCLVTGGRDEEAWEVLDSCCQVLDQMHEAGADVAVWHAAAGVALYHCEDLQAAFDHCVRAYVIRSECLPLGSMHPDTAAAAHNLGVVLDCLGKSSRGLQLVEQAQQVLSECLGPGHPRTLAAARNAQHIKHKIIKLPAEPQELMQNAASAAASQQRSSSAVCNIGKVSDHKTGRIKQQSKVKKHSRQQSTDDDSSSSEYDNQPKRSSSSSTNGNGVHRPTGSRAVMISTTPGGRQSAVRAGSMQERLQAVSKNRLEKAAKSCRGSTAGSSKPQYIDTREYTDPDYLGSGVFKASQSQKQVYEAVKADIAAHARSSSQVKPEHDAVEMQVVLPGVSPKVFPTSAAVMGISGSCSACSRPASAAPGTAAGARGGQGLPAATAGGQLARRGPLLDATVAAVKKPLTIEQARRLRRQQQLAAADAAGRLGRPGREGEHKRGLRASLLDKLF